MTHLSGDRDQQVFHKHRNLLFSVAYRLLGIAADAEDAVQDAWIKWSSADRSQVADPKAYLTRIVSNLSLERLRSTRYKRETYVGPWLPEPILTSGDTAEAVTDAESVSMAMLVVLETLSPLERAVFVLKEVFDFSHAEIAEAVERSEAAVRQAAHRAREHVRARRPRFTTDRPRQREITERFFAAATGGDVNALMELLSPDVTLWTDGGGKVRQALRPVVGAQTVAAWFAAIGTVTYQGVEPADMNAELVEINGGPGMLFSGSGRVIATVTFDFDADGRITSIHNVANPDKLQAVADGTAHDVGTR
ncbi:RNA polymerase sigma-70 factor [Streptomyces sp. NBC_01707]|uniref:RNA polymerase sigma-70 factor n=1 Tax=unclassified Streptomyces TaxID=2593676 RepID=UPI0029B27529|nr:MULTISPECIES: RNA polymerase sigma-70 factor [unclassified Streptomyces]MDX3770683.1 RNA polymerase sigma-70 factor [Streptomyces sp. AK08-01B]MDX3819157.1 RNA polymerase sigma-70 factor [Streptomyces sp. AK08-01A]